ncbi:MAG: Ig-like domain-containing protein [Planctomycetota bacterium]|nr:Ig-like domain-containing protein [Planctomycetota bacterium]
MASLALLAACGGGGGGSAASGGAGRGLILLTFHQQGLDNVSLNTSLRFEFSDDVDPSTISSQTLQIRRGGAFGLTVAGTFLVNGSVVTFEPRLPSLCDLSDSAFEPNTQYRVQILGHPEEFSVRNTAGQPLDTTRTYEFRTRVDTDPDLFTDQLPSAGPTVTNASPASGTSGVPVAPGNRIVLTLSENLKPCSVNADSVRMHIYQMGHAPTMAPTGNGTTSGFATGGGDTSDQTPTDHYTWGTPGTMPNVTTLGTPQRVLTNIELQQSLSQTQVVITPQQGFNPDPALNGSLFPENALIVVEMTFEVEDFGGSPMQPFTMSFTTENLPLQDGTYLVDNRGETPWDTGLSTARIIEAAPGRVQGFMLFAGDGDNGADQSIPSLPQSDPGTCLIDFQSNNGVPDDFDPAADILLDTGASTNTCPNGTDGSFAVVWEFNTLTIRNGITVRLVGSNPAIILVQGDVTIEAGGRLLARGDGSGGSPRGAGGGNRNATTTQGTTGGEGVAGGGRGGDGPAGSSAVRRVGDHGVQGYYHSTPQGPLAPDVGDEGATGGGHGNTSARWQSQTNPNNRNTPSGGGGGHAEAGQPGVALGTGTAPTVIDTPLDGVAGAKYGDDTGKMLTPEAGSGGGAGGELRPFTGTVGRGPGGAGGAGGGFVDLTSGGDILINGTLEAAGSVGGSNPGGNFNPNYSWNPGVGGGGGGSGGGIRLLTPNDIILGATGVVTAAGGAGGAGGTSQGVVGPPINTGGEGGAGRICMEDGNSIITGLASAGVTPAEGSPGFYRGVFNANRFQGGGLTPVAISDIFAVGPFDPDYITPQQIYPATTDFDAGTTPIASIGPGKTVMMIEMRGYQMLPDGLPDTTGVIALPTAWHTVGHFTDSGIDIQPTWVLGQPPLADIGGTLPTGNTGVFGIDNLDSCEYVQLRITIYLASGSGPVDPGHWLDNWTIRFQSDQ